MGSFFARSRFLPKKGNGGVYPTREGDNELCPQSPHHETCSAYVQMCIGSDGGVVPVFDRRRAGSCSQDAGICQRVVEYRVFYRGKH